MEFVYEMLKYFAAASVISIAMIDIINPLNVELYPICHLLTLLGAHPILHVSRIRVNRIHDRVQSVVLFTLCGASNRPISF